MDFRECKARTARQNLEAAFSVAEKDLGITRLLDPEDVDTKHVDEKSMITYISSLYELWPEPAERKPRSKAMTEEELIKINTDFQFLQQCIEWVQNRIEKLNSKDWGTDLQTVQFLLEEQKQDHLAINEFQSNVDKCSNRKNAYQGQELEIYKKMLNKLTENYFELMVMSNRRVSDLETLLDFLQVATNEMK